MFEITSTSIDVNAAVERMRNIRAGGYVAFEGWVRNHHEGQSVLKLEYEAFEALCKSEAEKIRAEALEKFDIIDTHCVHRVGECMPGELAVWIGVTAEHRGTAFAACEYYIDQLKLRVPVWKKETYTDGTTTWVQCECVAHLQGGEGHHHHH